MAGLSERMTFLFTDVEGSTRLWESEPGAMALALERHDTLVRSAIEDAGGYVFKTVGDAFCAAFVSGLEALEAAGAAQRALLAEVWPDEMVIRVRMALNTGECVERDRDYFGPTVNRTARMEAIANGGQIVVSRSTADLVGDALPEGMTLVALGSHLLKDLERPEEVFQLVGQGLPADFPPLRSRRVGNPTNLGESVSRLVGRTVEIAELIKLLEHSRLVTLTGSGGVGKTRLAIEVGRTALNHNPEGVWLVELATVTDPSLVASKVLGDLGIAGQAGRNAVDTLAGVLAAQNRVVILDNCEQVIDSCAALADVIVRKCPEVTVLSTSREPLRIAGEVIYRVPSLSLPPEYVGGLSDLANSGAVALFVERASTQSLKFQLRDDDAHLVASICSRLGGMPLALELAAARLRSMSLGQLHDRMEQRFELLTGGSRVALPRQQTLRATMDWSYELLTESERALFRRVSAFVDGFDLEAAERVCPLEDLPASDIADLLASLVDKSLVAAEPYKKTLRYSLLETLRQYAAERLAEAGTGGEGRDELERVVAAHSDYYVAFAEQAAPYLSGRSQREWRQRLESEDWNLREAIVHSPATPQGAERVLAQFWSLPGYWLDAPHGAQTLVLLEDALERAGPDITPGLRAQALLFKATILSRLDRRHLLELAATAVDLARQAADRALEAQALAHYSGYLAGTGKLQDALDTGADAVLLARQIGDPVILGIVLHRYTFALKRSETSAAETAFLEALGIFEQCGDERMASILHNNYATLLIEQGNLAGARRHLELALELSGTETTNLTSAKYVNLGWVLLQEGDVPRAASNYSEVLRFASLNGDVLDVAYAVLGLACCANRSEAPDIAAVLHGGADALLSLGADEWEAPESNIRAHDIANLRDRLGDEFERRYSEGLTMSQSEIIRWALTTS
jgi:predicted ATPase/class 3 adenylate cyclase/Tfp pilus assembly protein PilF